MFVYLIKADEYTKIGVASNVDKRIRVLQTGNHFKLEKIFEYETDDSCDIEQFLHKKYIQKQAYGEWFKLTKSDIKDILSDIVNFDSSNKIKDYSFIAESTFILDVVNDINLSIYERAVLVYMYTKKINNRVRYISEKMEYIAKNTNMSLIVLRRTLKSLEEKKYLIIDKSVNKINNYRIINNR